ncbi:hypothetical protein HDU97_004831 [Phlyctochytrium planicorne]|nr:hypothetical protein HDU97_004831 [Phlyctochytrium planicorne]
MAKKALVWFRLNLRLHDNEALVNAIKANPAHVFPVFTIDPHYATRVRVGIRRWQFLLECLKDLDQSLRNIGSRLLVCRGNPAELFPHLFKEWGITSLYMMAENQGGWSAQRDIEIKELAARHGVTTFITEGHNLYSLAKVVELNKGRPPTVYNTFLSVIKRLPTPPKPLDAPTQIPPIDETCLHGRVADIILDTPIGDHVLHRDPMDVNKREMFFKVLAGPHGDFTVPDITEFGFEPLPALEQSPHKGGETVGLKTLKAYMAQKSKVAKFEKPNTSPAAFKPADTTVLSPHLKFGSLSCRTFYWDLMDVYMEIKTHTSPPTSLLGQLLWREFYYCVAYFTPNYSRMSENRVSLQVDWWCRDGPVDAQNPEATEHLKAWSEARTGFPWIDAIMTQLRKEGWIHHLARHSVACFLTRGDLFISWERGAEVFEELLLDHDPALNIGNWLWLSASAFFTQYIRVYSPVAFGKKYDKTGKYIRRYVPVLKNLPTEYIFEPWKAPKKILENAGVILGQNYPFPIVKHEEISKINIKRIGMAYKAGFRGGPNSQIPDTLEPLQAVVEMNAVANAEDSAESEEEEEEDEAPPPPAKRKAAGKAKAEVTKKTKGKK